MNTLQNNKKLVAAAFVSDLPTIRSLITDDFTPYIELNDETTPYFPIWGITECQRWIFGGDWNGNEYEESVKSLLRKNQEVMTFWKDALHLPVEPVNFQRYTEVFYADDPLDSFEEQEREEYISNGNAPIDVDLWIAVNKKMYALMQPFFKEK